MPAKSTTSSSPRRDGKPSKADMDRGGFNPRPREEEKEQFGPMPTDAPRDDRDRDDDDSHPRVPRTGRS